MNAKSLRGALSAEITRNRFSAGAVQISPSVIPTIPQLPSQAIPEYMVNMTVTDDTTLDSLCDAFAAQVAMVKSKRAIKPDKEIIIMFREPTLTKHTEGEGYTIAVYIALTPAPAV